LVISKSILSILCLEMFNWFKRMKKSPKNRYLVIHMLSYNRSAKLWFSSFNKEPVSLRVPLSQHLSSWANGYSNETNAHCVLPPSRHTKDQIDVRVRDGIWCDWEQMKYISKLMSDLLKFFAAKFILGEEGNNYLNIFFSFFINS